MGDFVQALVFTIAGIILLWFGYSLFFSPSSPFYPGWTPWSKWGKKNNGRGRPGDPQVCPICSMRLDKGELVKSFAFSSQKGVSDRLMYIRGCFTCLERDVPRRCPICGLELSLDDYLVARMFERPNSRNHVHVLGCNHCKNLGKLIK
ncbi:MAG: DUF3185 family protein [Treponema sp.]|jgi:hypothetical protein|nr:DUF3185 family protein [Treponema sp.]